MKILVTVLGFCLLAVSGHAQKLKPKAEDVLKPAYAQAAKQNKKVLLMFHAAWCGWCHKMDSSLADQSVKPLIDKNFVISHLSVYEHDNKKYSDNPGAVEMLRANNNGKDSGIPFWLILDKNGKVLANANDEENKNSGCPASEKEVAYFLRVLRKTTALNDNELKVIETRFRKNEN